MSSLLAGPPRRSQWLVVSVNRFRAVTAAAACGTGTAAPGNWGPRAATRATLRAAARAEEIMMQTAGNKTRTGPPVQRSNGCDSCGGLIVAQADAKLLGHHHSNCDSANWVKDHHKSSFHQPIITIQCDSTSLHASRSDSHKATNLRQQMNPPQCGTVPATLQLLGER